MIEVPFPTRVQFNDDFPVTRIRIPESRMWVGVIFLGFWLCGWAVGEVFAITLVFFRPWQPGSWFVLFWLTFWTFGGTAALYQFFNLSSGCEVIEFSTVEISFYRTVAGFGAFKKTYPMAECSNLRLVHLPSILEETEREIGHIKDQYGNIQNVQKVLPIIRFLGTQAAKNQEKPTQWLLIDTRSKSVPFASNITQEEAKFILDTLLERYPNLRP
jgi:hypothetical protein